MKNEEPTHHQEIITPDGEILGRKKGLWERFIAPLGLFGVIGFLTYSFFQLYAGFVGIEHHLGTGWAIGAVFLALLFRFTLPLTIGSFFGAMNVWGWHWFFALIFAAPGLVIFFAILLTGGILGASIVKRQR